MSDDLKSSPDCRKVPTWKKHELDEFARLKNDIRYRGSDVTLLSVDAMISSDRRLRERQEHKELTKSQTERNKSIRELNRSRVDSDITNTYFSRHSPAPKRTPKPQYAQANISERVAPYYARIR